MTSIETLETTTFSGRRFTRKQLIEIQETVARFKKLSRKELAATICEHLQWISPNRTNKIMSCLKLLEDLEEFGLIQLPAKRHDRKPVHLPSKIEAKHEAEFCASLNDIGPIVLERITTKENREEYKNYLRKYHYLGFKHAVGNQIAYFVVANHSRQKLGCILFSGAATYSLAARDTWIGWNDSQRKKLLPLVIRNNRFLIFPWINVPHLASKALSIATNRVSDDWLSMFKYRPVLIETFVDKTKYNGTCYQAANWQLVGETTSQKRDELGDKKSIKDIYLYPLRNDFRKHLTGEVSVATQMKKHRNDLKSSHSRAVDDEFVQTWEKVIHVVHDVAAEYDDKWRIRKRLISTLILILFIFRLVSSKKAQGYATTIDELWDSCKALNLPLPQKSSLAPSSLCDARQKLDEEVFRCINRRIIQEYTSWDENAQWMGHRIFAVDGSKIHLPRTLLDDGYVLPSPTSGYPQGLVSCLYQLKTQIPFDFELSSHADERAAAEKHLAHLTKDDVVVYDRGYLSYYLLHSHVVRDIHAVFRLPEASFCEIQNFFESDKTDTIVTLNASPGIKTQIRKNYKDFNFIPIQLRLVKYTYNQTTYCLGTTLLSPRYTLQDLADLYFARWGVEELYKVSKRVFLVEDFHAKIERGVKQELYAHFVLITMNRIFSNHADSLLEGFNPSETFDDRTHQTNFTNCVHVFARCFEGLLMFHHTIREKIQDSFRLISRQFSKVRNGRSYTRKSMKPNRNWNGSNRYKKKVAENMVVVPC